MFDADDPKFKHFEVSRLVGLGAIKPVVPEAEESLALAELGDKELSALASRLGVADVAKKTRGQLVREVVAAQAMAGSPPAPNNGGGDGKDEGAE